MTISLNNLVTKNKIVLFYFLSYLIHFNYIFNIELFLPSKHYYIDVTDKIF